ncbi:MAG: YebC/PmpR family DNA-binding transcriptional regulator [Deltaproteobacteria bacterium]|nr:YebC/PmpR family DNA-binding transcriptional regulator [Deltaproteobacteria bacterium]
MSGHSKWATIKHKKSAADAKRGRLFTKLIKEITIAAKMGGGNPDNNPRLRTAIDAAKDANMPSENIERAIKKGTGELEGVNYEECIYEGYGAAGVAIIVEAATDNKNRTTAELRKIFSKFNGNLGESGCVGWMFNKKGEIIIEGDKISEDELMEIALNAGADDVINEDGTFTVYTSVQDYSKVLNAIKAKGITPISARIGFIPQNYVKPDSKDAESVLKLIENLEEHDDVQNVSTNLDIDENLLKSMQDQK